MGSKALYNWTVTGTTSTSRVHSRPIWARGEGHPAAANCTQSWGCTRICPEVRWSTHWNLIVTSGSRGSARAPWSNTRLPSINLTIAWARPDAKRCPSSGLHATIKLKAEISLKQPLRWGTSWNARVRHLMLSSSPICRTWALTIRTRRRSSPTSAWWRPYRPSLCPGGRGPLHMLLLSLANQRLPPW